MLDASEAREEVGLTPFHDLAKDALANENVLMVCFESKVDEVVVVQKQEASWLRSLQKSREVDNLGQA